MKRFTPFIILAIAVVTLASYLRKTDAAPLLKDNYKLVWSDDFDGTGTPDPSLWTYDVGGQGWGNNELQFYTRARQENARRENGKLVIEARRENWENRQYTSARLLSKTSWQYGKVEVRAKLPEGLGTWPAIWMLAATNPLKWPDDGEIDIMEHVGYDPGRIHGTVHCKDYNHTIGTQKANQIMVPDFATAFHTYQLEWDKDSIRVGMDNKHYFRFGREAGKGYGAWPFDNKFYLILNIAVGGNWGGQKGVDSTIWPRRMEVDWVKVYQKN
jgi:beta-glucanase (GH16 family)